MAAESIGGGAAATGAAIEEPCCEVVVRDDVGDKDKDEGFPAASPLLAPPPVESRNNCSNS
jgi:hypothetical protein